MSLTRWSPLRQMMSLQDELDRLTGQAFGRPWWETDGGAVMVPMDMTETDNEVKVMASLPGVKPEDVEITVTGNTLNIKGEFKAEEETERGNVYFRERRYGSFHRSLMLPSDVEADKAEATFENGVLKLTLPKTEEARPKQIEVKGQQSKQQVEVQGKHES